MRLALRPLRASNTVQDLLQSEHVGAKIASWEWHDRIADQLPGRVERDLATSLGPHDRRRHAALASWGRVRRHGVPRLPRVITGGCSRRIRIPGGGSFSDGAAQTLLQILYREVRDNAKVDHRSRPRAIVSGPAIWIPAARWSSPYGSCWEIRGFATIRFSR